MKRLLASLILIACLPAFSSAMWGYIPLQELVQDSDLILVGTLSGVSEFSTGGIDYGEGLITVDEVMWGNSRPGDTLTLKWQNPTGLVCPRIEHRQNQDVRAVWLLTTGNANEVRANYPGRFVKLADKYKVERILRKKNVCLRAAKYVVSNEEQTDVSLVFRNPTQTALTFPGIQVRDGGLYIGAGVDLTVSIVWLDTETWVARETKVNPAVGRVVVSDDLAPIMVPPGREARITLNVLDFFNLAPNQTYILRLDVAGYDPANKIRLYVNAAKPAKKEARSGAQRSSVVSHGPGIALELSWLIGLIALVKWNRARVSRSSGYSLLDPR